MSRAEPVQTAFKVCGITTESDARLVVDVGADYIGFILYPKSPRYIAPERIREITSGLPSSVRRVGVFVNESAADIARIMEFCGLDIAQLHGDEPADVAHELGVERVWKACVLRTPHDVDLAMQYPAAAVLVDSITKGARGGTGQVGNWQLAADLAGRRRMILAGGLGPENITDALRQVRPFAVDVNSGVETAPGVKDHVRVREFARLVRLSESETQ